MPHAMTLLLAADTETAVEHAEAAEGEATATPRRGPVEQDRSDHRAGLAADGLGKGHSARQLHLADQRIDTVHAPELDQGLL